MGIEQDNKLAAKAIAERKPTEYELKIGKDFADKLRCSGNPEAPAVFIPKLLAAHRIYVTAQVLVGEGYESQQDLEKRSILSAENSNLRRRVDELQEENTRLAQAAGRAAAEVIRLQRPVEEPKPSSETWKRYGCNYFMEKPGEIELQCLNTVDNRWAWRIVLGGKEIRSCEGSTSKLEVAQSGVEGAYQEMVRSWGGASSEIVDSAVDVEASGSAGPVDPASR